jgi:hypothetical protein
MAKWDRWSEWYQRKKLDPEWMEKRRAVTNASRLKRLKNDPTFAEQNRTKALAYYHKKRAEDPEAWRAKRREQYRNDPDAPAKALARAQRSRARKKERTNGQEDRS